MRHAYTSHSLDRSAPIHLVQATLDSASIDLLSKVYVVANRNYWLNVFSATTWQEFLDNGAQVSGFPETRWSIVQRIKPGDYLLCYLTKVCCWIAVLEVTSEPFFDTTTIWKQRIFPCRVYVNVVVNLTWKTAVPVSEIRDKIPLFQNLRLPNRWGALFQTSPSPWTEVDGKVVVNALMEAKMKQSTKQ